MHIIILTLFPQMFEGPLHESILRRAQEKKKLNVECINIRDFALDRHKSVDDHPYGGGAGMILRVDVVDRALTHATAQFPAGADVEKILLDPRGKRYEESHAVELSKHNGLILICGHYEGVDERIRTLVDREISIGDYILTGGELAAMIVTDSVTRLLPGVLEKTDATIKESFSERQGKRLLEYPQYTRPPEYKEMTVPDILLSGNHKDIEHWQHEESLRLTHVHRPDLVAEPTEKMDRFSPSQTAAVPQAPKKRSSR